MNDDDDDDDDLKAESWGATAGRSGSRAAAAEAATPLWEPTTGSRELWKGLWELGWVEGGLT